MYRTMYMSSLCICLQIYIYMYKDRYVAQKTSRRLHVYVWPLSPYDMYMKTISCMWRRICLIDIKRSSCTCHNLYVIHILCYVYVFRCLQMCIKTSMSLWHIVTYTLWHTHCDIHTQYVYVTICDILCYVTDIYVAVTYCDIHIVTYILWHTYCDIHTQYVYVTICDILCYVWHSTICHNMSQYVICHNMSQYVICHNTQGVVCTGCCTAPYYNTQGVIDTNPCNRVQQNQYLLGVIDTTPYLFLKNIITTGCNRVQHPGCIF